MSTGPFPFARQVMDLDSLLAAIGGAGWDGLAASVRPAPVPERFEPEDELKRWVAAFYRTAEGRQLFDWIADLTLRAPFPPTGNDFQSAALAAAKHEARVAVGRVIFAAIAAGDELLNNRSQNHEKPA